MNTRLVAVGLAIYALSTLLSMAAMSIGVALAFLLLLIGLRGPVSWWRMLRSDVVSNRWCRRYLFAASALALACVLSLVVAWVSPLGYGGSFVKVSFLKDIAKLWYLFLPLLLMAPFRRLAPGEKKAVITTWLTGFLVLAAIGVVQHFTGWPRRQPIPYTLRYHATLFLGHHLSVASIMIFPFFATLDLARRKGASSMTWLPRAVLLLSVLLGLAMLAATYSRMLWLALPVGLVLWTVLVLPRRWAVGAAVVLALAIAGVAQVPEVQRRMNDGLGVGTRFELWKANWEFFKARPLTGAGWHHNLELAGYYLSAQPRQGGPIFVGHAHNNVIEMLGGTGALGLLTWAFWCLTVLVLTWSNLKREKAAIGFSLGLFCAWIVFQLNGLTQVNFWESKVLHQMMLVTAWSLAWSFTREEGTAE